MKYFKIEELISPTLLKKLSPQACWLLIPKIVQDSLDKLRDDFNEPIFINGNYKGKLYKESGVRSLDSSVGAKSSRHKIYNDSIAFDLKCENMDKLISLIIKDHHHYNVTRIENPEVTIGWLHVEFSFKNVTKKLIVFNP